MPLITVRNDITKMNTEVVVLPANRGLHQGSGTSRAIYEAAGEEKVTNELRFRYPEGCLMGQAVATAGYNLNARYIIHAVCPPYRDGNHDERENLYNAYRNSLELASLLKVNSISFPLLSAGNYGYPKEEAIAVANQAITEFLLVNEMDVYLVLYEKDTVDIGNKVFREITEYIDSRYVEEKDESYGDYEIRRFRFEREMLDELDCEELEMVAEDRSEVQFSIGGAYANIGTHSYASSIDDKIKITEETFHEMLMRLIDESGMTGPQIYDRALMSKQLYSKIKTDPDKQLKKKTILSLAIALRLSMSTTQTLLMKAGYALSDSSKYDLAISFFLENEKYNIDDINIALERLGIEDYFGYN